MPERVKVQGFLVITNITGKSNLNALCRLRKKQCHKKKSREESSTFTCSKLTIETLEQGVKCVQS